MTLVSNKPITLTEEQRLRLAEAINAFARNNELPSTLTSSDRKLLTRMFPNLGPEIPQDPTHYKLLDWLNTASVVISIIVTAAAILGAAGAMLAIISGSAYYSGLGALAGAAIGGVGALFIQGRILRSIVAKQIITTALDITVRDLFLMAGHNFRANVFLPKGLVRKTLRLIYCSSNMEHAPDRSVSLEKGQGASGQAWAREAPVVANLTWPEARRGASWGLAPSLVAKTAKLKAILAVPIRHPKSQYGVVGVLSFDSEDDVVDFFMQDKAQKFGQITAQQMWVLLHEMKQI